MGRRAAIGTIALGVALMALHGCDAGPESTGMLPDEVIGWTPDGEDGLYDGETLYDYIDGGAEVYRALGVRSVVGRRYVKDGGPEIVADVFDMGTAAGAYGAYHHDPRDGGTVGIGTESEYVDGALAFWKDRYFVSILAMDDTEETEAAVLAIGRRAEQAIPTEGEIPGIVRALPRPGLLDAHVRLFRGPMLLDRYYDLGEGNPLGLDAATEGVLARYRVTGERDEEVDYVLLVVGFASPERAGLGLAGLVRLRRPEAVEEDAWVTDEGTWEGASARGPNLVAVFGAPDREVVETVLAEVSARATGPETQ